MRTLPATLAAALLLSGCGVLPAVDTPFPGEEPRATILVDNLETGYLGVPVFLQALNGTNQRLGRISSASEERFLVRNLREGDYTLEARPPGQAPMRSPPFMLRDGDTVEWTLADNRVVYRQEASAPAHPGVFEGPSAR